MTELIAPNLIAECALKVLRHNLAFAAFDTSSWLRRNFPTLHKYLGKQVPAYWPMPRRGDVITVKKPPRYSHAGNL